LPSCLGSRRRSVTVAIASDDYFSHALRAALMVERRSAVAASIMS
jgi:hypothetical protein